MAQDADETGVLTTDRELVVRSWDGWLADVTGIPAEMACGRSLAALFPEVEERGLVARLRRAAEEGAVEVLAAAFHQYLIPCASRVPSAHFRRMQQHVTLAPLREGEEIVGVVVTIRDVTARRERERQIAQQLRGGDEAARLRAVEALTAEAASPDVLVDAFDDRSWRVRSAAADAVAQHRGDGVVEVLTRVLREHHRDLGVLNATLSALASSGEEVLPPLLELLGSDDPDLRVYVALALGLRGDLRAVPALVRALGDEEPNVRFHAIEALGRLRARDAADPVMEVAESRDFFLSFAALEALAAIGDETVTPRILPLLDDEMLRSAAVAALARLGGEEVVASLAWRLALGQAEAAEAAAALAAIHARYQERFGDGDVIAALTRATAPADAARHLAAAFSASDPAEWPGLVRVLGWLGGAGVEALLVRALAEPRSRAAAVEGLVRLGSRAFASLGGEVGALDADALHGAVVALGRVGSTAAVPLLLDLLDRAPELAASIAEALGGIGDRRAFEPLLRLLEHPSAAVRQAAVGALNSVGHPELRERVRELLSSPSAPVRESAVRIAGYFGYTECADAVIALCADADAGVRRAAVEHAVFLDDPRVAGILEAALTAAEPTTRAAAARALARLDAPVAARLLPVALGDADLWVRYYAAISAGALGLDELAPRISELAAADPAVPVRIAAARALGALRAGQVSSALRALAADPEPDVRTAAVQSLGRSSDAGALEVLEELLVGADDTLRRTALDGMEAAAAGALAEPIARAARRAREPAVARAAALALLRADSPAAVRLLCGFAAEPVLRGLAVEALVRVSERHLPVLAEALRDAEERVREAVAEALAHRSPAAAERLVAGALDDRAPRVRRMAAHTLCRLDLRAAAGG